MYLKNTSNAAVVVNTVVGKVGIKPGEYVDVKYRILPPMSSLLVEITEEEFNSFRNPVEKTEDISVPEEIVDDTKAPELVLQNAVKETPVESSEIPVETTIATPVESNIDDIEIKDPGIMGFVNALLNPGQDDKDATKTEALIVTEAKPDTQINQLEQQLEDLKTVWSTTTNPRKKEKIGKEIKELQKQLKKLKK